MAPSSQQEAADQGEVVMNIPHMEDEEVTNKEEGEADVVATTAVATTTVAEGEEEEISIREAGQMEGVEGEVATKMVVIEIPVSSRVAIMVATVVATRVVVMVASKHLHIQEVDTRVVDISRTIDTKMEGIMVIEAVVAEGEVVAEAEVVDVQAREEVGEEEGARIITRGDNLNSTSSMEVISIIILDLDRADIILVEATEPYILLELK
ncbi:hypothetical protein E2I00_007372 [Balaenoptera physalus]|uniref:Uncharacterized protein n=1 Tax=Balaenoptera physalus TaxID=9770 RepID=A0A643BWW6_BALPH|nr:hypothetical protein E2I00_007372 [Balaenoptera physalus]